MTTQRADELLRLAWERAQSLARPPASTYRLQFHAGFTFQHAIAIVPYLADLGITHVYASPYLAAVAGSLHGYDVIDHNRLNPELGTETDYDAFLCALERHGLSHILDTVPNHVGVDTNENAWWNSTLEHGTASPFARYFDISWRGSSNPQLRDRLLIPTLGDSYAKTLEQGQLKLAFQPEDGCFVVNYYARQFPVSPSSYASILNHDVDELRAALGSDKTALADFQDILAAISRLPDSPTRNRQRGAQRVSDSKVIQRRLAAAVHDSNRLAGYISHVVAAINGSPGDPHSFDALDSILRRQCFRLAWWRVASDEINYRRFFDINGLAGLAMEREEVFLSTHAFTLRLAAQGKVTGLRIDHPDGLYNPRQYFQRVQRHFLLACAKEIARDQPEWADVDWKQLETVLIEERRTKGAVDQNEPPLYVVAEKILGAGEALPTDWECHGTSGYDFLAIVNALFVDHANKDAFSRIYQSISGQRETFAELAYQNKRLVLKHSFASELHRLTRRLERLSRKDRRARDFTFQNLQHVLRELIACFPVYRTYIDSQCVRDEDQAHLELATQRAMGRNPDIPPDLFHFVRDMLLQKSPDSFTEQDRAKQLRFAGKFQQLTSPTTAKGVEDTAFYVYQRFISLNEVGGDPSRFGIDPAELHRYLSDRKRRWPRALNALSTHDTKRSEDVRARLNVLSELPDEWEQCVMRWMKYNARHRRMVHGTLAPAPDEEYLLYQTLVGVWPLEDSHNPNEAFTRRIQQYMQKAIREAKLRTSWTTQDAEWESAVEAFVGAVLDTTSAHEFLTDIASFCHTVAHFGLINSLSQTLIRLAASGVPDTYQGAELWDFSLVDPDNRRPVDYDRRRRLMEEMKAIDASENPDHTAKVRAMLDQKENAGVKLWALRQALRVRRDHPDLFTTGDYLPLLATGIRSRHVFAFGRRQGNARALCIVPRLMAELAPAGDRLPLGDALWGDTRLALPDDFENHTFENVFTREQINTGAQGCRSRISVSAILATFPIALLFSEGKTAP